LIVYDKEPVTVTTYITVISCCYWTVYSHLQTMYLVIM